MTRNGRSYPDEPAGPFPTPPQSFADREDRHVEIRVADETDHEAIAAMYRDFDPADRAQGIPPTQAAAIDEWLDDLLANGLNVAAWHVPEGDGKGGETDGDRGTVAGHATLVPDRDPTGGGGGTGEDSDAGEPPHELAIFVLQAYQGAGIGGRLLRTLLGYGTREGVERVWLTVERWNHAAIGLYEDVGFERTGTQSFECEMAIRLS